MRKHMPCSFPLSDGKLEQWMELEQPLRALRQDLCRRQTKRGTLRTMRTKFFRELSVANL